MYIKGSCGEFFLSVRMQSMDKFDDIAAEQHRFFLNKNSSVVVRKRGKSIIYWFIIVASE